MANSEHTKNAHHEAAHAVIGLALGGNVEKVSIKDGLCVVAFGDIEEADDELFWLTSNIICFYAGFQGAVAAGFSVSWEEEAEDDYHKAGELLFKAAGNNAEYFSELQNSTMNTAKTMVQSCWPQIVRLANILVKEFEIEKEAIERLLDVPGLQERYNSLH